MRLPKSQGSSGLYLNYALDAASQYVEQEVPQGSASKIYLFLRIRMLRDYILLLYNRSASSDSWQFADRTHETGWENGDSDVVDDGTVRTNGPAVFCKSRRIKALLQYI